ncbi:right-handed parallel beta-helix repeat-containing protein [Demequina aurantiaca]|uniref:right-handed parallel beta-helix repeat-containing protein n=1 Tax=Demequina aurantiaca TaxID=676200 RepID=UPI003D331F85
MMRFRTTAVAIGLASILALVAAPAGAASSLDDDEGTGAPLLGADQEAEPQAELDPETEYVYPGDPAAEAALVAAEDRRLVDIDLVASGTLVPELDTTRPFRVSGSAVSTLVLTARTGPYTLDELSELAPQSVANLGGGTFRLNENVAILPGATFLVSARGPVELLLASQPEGFVSVISLGGSLVIQGSAESPARVRSWDAPQGQTDLDTSDGRAYLRAIGGQISISNAQLDDLGFWSGNTGGLALTGTDEVFGLVAGIDAVGGASSPDSPEPAAGVGTDAATAPEQGGGIATESAGEATATSLAAPTDEAVVDPGTGEGLIPLGVTAWISNVSAVGNAFGMFVSNAEQVEIRDSYVSESLVDGVVFHREVKSSNVVNTESSRNAGDGFRISRGSNGILLDSVTADGNGNNGITINAAPLATGPSAVGLSTESYGAHTVRDSVASSNADTGIELSGGTDIALTRNATNGGQFGIVVRDGAQAVALQDNAISGPAKQGVAVRDGSQVELAGNEISETVTGVYARDSIVNVNGNDIWGVTNHGVTITGLTDGSVVAKNTIAGVGASAIDVFRADAVAVQGDNDLAQWSTKSVQQVVVDSVTKPLTMMWILLGGLLILTAVLGIRHRRHGVRHPYRGRTPLSELTRGMVDPSSVPGVNVPGSADLSDREAPEAAGPAVPVHAPVAGTEAPQPSVANPGRARREDGGVTRVGLPRRFSATDHESVGV